MYVARVPNRGSPPAILLRESYRQAGKVKNRTLANLSAWPEAKVDALSRVLKGQPPAAALEGTFEITRSLPHGHVAAVLGTLRQLGLEELLDPAPSRHRDLVTAMAVAQVTAPDSKLAIARGLRGETAASSLGQVLGAGGCDEDDLYAAMDWLAARQQKIEDALAARHLAGGTLVLYDVPAAAFEGRTCPLGAIGHPKDGVRGRLQIACGLLTSTDGVPVAIEVFEGNTGDPKTVASQGEQGQGPVRPHEGGAGRGPGDADRGAAARGHPACGPGLDHRAARPAGQGAGPRRRAPARAVRPDGPGRDQPSGLSRRAAGRLQEPVPGSRAGPQAGSTAGRHRSRPGENRRSCRAGTPAAARHGQDRA